MKTEFDPVTHIGKVDGEIWPSVTQLLQEFKLVDFSNVPDERLEFKRILGTRVHAATVLIDNGSFDEDHAKEKFPEILPYLESYRKFRTIEDFEPIHKEMRLFSKLWKFHGAPDESGINLGIHHDRLCIVDYKCTWAMYASAGPQLYGYEMLIRENASALGLPPQLIKKSFRRFGLLLKPNKNYDLVKFENPNDEQDFKACLWLHWRKRNHYKTSKGELENANGNGRNNGI